MADSKNGRIQILDEYGAVTGIWYLTGVDGGPSVPVSLAYDEASKTIYVLDSWQDTILKLDDQGAVIGRIGKHGNQPGELSQPSGIAMAHSKIYVADTGNGRVEVFDGSGSFIMELGKGILKRPLGIALGNNGTVYVTDQEAGGALKFDAGTGMYLGSLAPAGMDLKQAHDLSVSPDGTVYIMDTMNSRVVAFSELGGYMGSYGTFGTVSRIGNLQTADRYFNQPEGVYADDTYLFVADTHNDRIVKIKYDELGLLSPLAALAVYQNPSTETPMPVPSNTQTPTVTPTEVPATAIMTWTPVWTATSVPTTTSLPTPVSLAITAQASPNPFRPLKGQNTTITYTLSASAMVAITATERNGNVWKTWSGITGAAGMNQMVWDGRSDAGQYPPPGQSDFSVSITVGVGNQRSQTSFILTVTP